MLKQLTSGLERPTIGEVSLEGLYGRPGFKIRRAHQIAVAIFGQATAELNITTSQYGILHILAKIEGLDQITLAGLVGLDRSTTSSVLGLLEQRGSVERIQNTDDRRKRVLRLTDSGRQLYEAAQFPVTEAISRLMEAASPPDVERFLDLLERIVATATPPVEPGLARKLKDLYRRPGFLIRRVHQISSALLVEEARPHEVTPTQYGMMYILKQRPGLDQVTLARLGYFDRSTNSMVVDALQNRGWIERRVDPTDRRRRLLTLSPEGMRILAELEIPMGLSVTRLMSSLNKTEQTFLAARLDAINAHFDTLAVS